MKSDTGKGHAVYDQREREAGIFRQRVRIRGKPRRRAAVLRAAGLSFGGDVPPSVILKE